MKTENIYNRINSFEEYEKKMTDYKNQIIKMMIGKKGKPIPCHVMIVSGDKGVGKTYTAEQILSNQDIRNYEIVTNAMSAVNLYKFMWEHNDAIIVLDDVNSIIQDNKDGASLLKAATDSYMVRKLSWQKQNAMCIPVQRYNLKTNEEIMEQMDKVAAANDKLQKHHLAGKTFPDSFYFTGALIILTNKPLSVIDRVTEGAVSNRGWHQEMLFSVDGAVDLIKHFKNKMDCYNGIDIAPENIEKAIKFLTSKKAIKYYKENGKVPTLRTLGKMALNFEMDMPVDDDSLVNETERPAY